MFEIGSSWVQF